MNWFKSGKNKCWSKNIWTTIVWKK